MPLGGGVEGGGGGGGGGEGVKYSFGLLKPFLSSFNKCFSLVVSFIFFRACCPLNLFCILITEFSSILDLFSMVSIGSIGLISNFLVASFFFSKRLRRISLIFSLLSVSGIGAGVFSAGIGYGAKPDATPLANSSDLDKFLSIISLFVFPRNLCW